MKNLIMSLAILATLILASPLKAQDRSDGRRLIVTQAEATRVLKPKGWDGKVQGLFREEIAFIHLQGQADFENLGSLVADYFTRKSGGQHVTLIKAAITQTRTREKFLAIKTESKEGLSTAFFPVTSEGPQGIILATNGTICHAGSECAECSPNTMTHVCSCSDEVKSSPMAKCQYGGDIAIKVSAEALNELAAIELGTVNGDGETKIDNEVLTREVQSIIPTGFRITKSEIKAFDKEYYSLTSLQNRERKSYIFINKLENQGGNLMFRNWGFLYHCEGMCGFSVPQCESTSPFTALNGQLSCGCNGHCAPKFGFIAQYKEIFKVKAFTFYP